MDPETPWWLVITASAVGGALVNVVWNAVDRLLERRHRHDETRRDHYVALMTALDELQQGLVSAESTWRLLPLDRPPGEWKGPELDKRLTLANENGIRATRAYETAR